MFWEWLTNGRRTLEALVELRNPHDPPDFCFKHQGLSIGLEHTHVFRSSPGNAAAPSPLHSLEIGRRVCGHLQTLLRAKSNQIPPVIVTISFTSCAAIRPSQERTIAQRLFDRIREKFRMGGGLQFAMFRGELADINPSLDNILVAEGTGLATVCHYSSGDVDECGLPAIEAAATEKGKALPRYKSSFDQCWLLLGAGGAHREQWIEPSEEACAEGITSEFDRVFLVDESSGKVYEIQTKGVAVP